MALIPIEAINNGEPTWYKLYGAKKGEIQVSCTKRFEIPSCPSIMYQHIIDRFVKILKRKKFFFFRLFFYSQIFFSSATIKAVLKSQNEEQKKQKKEERELKKSQSKLNKTPKSSYKGFRFKKSRGFSSGRSTMNLRTIKNIGKGFKAVGKLIGGILQIVLLTR